MSVNGAWFRATFSSLGINSQITYFVPVLGSVEGARAWLLMALSSTGRAVCPSLPSREYTPLAFCLFFGSPINRVKFVIHGGY